MNHVNFVHILDGRNLVLTGNLYVIKVIDCHSGKCIRSLQSSGLVSSSPNDFTERNNDVPDSESVI